LEAAAGLAGVVKSVMMLESGIIPPNIHLRNRNPDIMFDEWKLRIPTAVMPWPTDGLRRISINSFGYGGSNAHAILDDSHSYLSGRRHQDNINSVRTSELGRQTMTFPNGTSKSAGNGLRAAAYLLFAISSQDKDGIERVKQRLAAFLASKAAQLQTIQETDAYLADLAFTLNTRRSHLQWKTFSIASSPDELLDALTSTEPTTTPTPRMSSRKPRLGFIFTGQGAQWAGMGQELLRHAPFRTSVAAADTFLRTQLSSPWTASEELQKGKSGSRVGTAALGQALCTVLQVALVDLLRAWGVRPLAVVGHSSGEIAAAYCAGILRREDAWRVAYFRGVVAARLREGAEAVDGAMMAVGASEVDAAEMIRRSGLEGEVHVACVNSPRSITVSGGVDGVDRLCDALQAENVFARKLQVDTAYHSPHMELVAQEYFEAIADVSVNPRVGDSIMYSSVSGGAAEPSELGPAYWVRNLISPVLFASAVQHLAHNDFPADADCGGEDCAAVDVLVEVGPHSALQGPTTQSLQAIGLPDIPYHSILTRHRSGDETALELAGNLFVRGYPVDFREINQSAPNCKTLVDLPVYPWNHTQANWAESRLSSEYRLRETLRASFLGAPTPTLVAGESVWRGHIRLSREPWIADHEIQGTVLYPAAGFLAMAIEAALSSAEAGRRVARLRLRDIHLTTALVVAEEADVEYSVCLRPHLSANRETSSLWAEFVVSSCQDGKALERNCLGLIMVEYGLSDADSARAKDEDEGVAMLYRDTTEVCKTTVRAEQFYRDLAAVGLQYGPAFRNLTEVRTAPGRSCCVVDIPDVGFRLGLHQRPHVIHPGTLDAIFHMAFAALRGTSGSCNSIAQAMVPKSIDDVLISTDLPYHAGTQLRGISSAARHGLKEILADMTVVNGPKNYPVLQISGLCCTEIAGASNGEQYGSNAARSICSKLIWRPAIDLLGLEEQRNVISKAVNNTLQSQKKLQSIDSTKSIAAALSEVNNPITTISVITQ
jgi:zearalenone synthase (highly reducing iterative type I polyketide synthase)